MAATGAKALQLERSVALKEQTAEKIKKQRIAIDKVRLENQVLAQELSLESRQSKMTSNEFAKKHVKSLRDEGDAYVRKIEVEKRKIADLEEQVAAMQSKVFDQRHKVGGLNATRDNSKMIAKQIQILENRLDKSLVHYNEALGKNKELREKIDELRRERVVFDGIYKKLEREIHDRSKELKELVQEADAAYKQRDAMQTEMAALKVRAEQESNDFEREWKELTKAIEADRKVHDGAASDGKAAAGKNGNRGDLTIEQERDLKKKIAQGAWLIGKDKANIQVSQDKVASYEEAFNKIQSATGIGDIDELVDKFIEAEDKNYSLFNYVNQLAAEIEKLEAQVADTKNEIEKYKGQGVNSDNQRKRILRELEGRLEKTHNKAEAYDAKYQAAMNHINQLKTSIMTIFSKTGCNTPGVAELLGSQGVTEANMMQYLGIIEQRINELLHAYSTLMRGAGVPAPDFTGSRPSLRAPADMFEEADKPKTTRQAMVAQPSPKPSRAVLKVRPPDWDDLSSDSGSDDEDTRPLTLEELHRTPLRFREKRKHREDKLKPAIGGYGMGATGHRKSRR